MKTLHIFAMAVLMASLFLFLAMPAFSQMPAQKLTQGEFAKNLCRTMKLERSLPLAPIAEDYFDILYSYSIAPLTGWDAKKELTEEDYVVVMAFAAGEEKLVVDTAKEACNRYADIITKKWKLYYDIEGKWPTLQEFFADKNYFPYGPPVCPYRKLYTDKSNDHVIEKHRHH